MLAKLGMVDSRCARSTRSTLIEKGNPVRKGSGNRRRLASPGGQSRHRGDAPSDVSPAPGANGQQLGGEVSQHLGLRDDSVARDLLGAFFDRY